MAGFKPYFRPNQKWECGWAAIGKPCPRGPSAKGRCAPQSECRPLKTDGGYKCSRPPQFGGKCNLGPKPDGQCSHVIPTCSPRLSIRAKRGLLAVCISALSLGVVFMQLGRKEVNQGFISPGPLSSQHRSVEHDCMVCHKDMQTNLASIIGNSVHPRASADQCLNCHKMDENALFAHSLPPENINEMTSAHGGIPPSQAEQMQCATCHREHGGMLADISALSNRQCQTCHTKQFDGFEVGHSNFSETYPFNRRTRILFDHAAHFAQFFPEAGAENISCQTCHTADTHGQNMIPQGFEKSCATCHGPQIQGVDQTQKGIVFFRVPSLDIESLKAKKRNIGSWPEDADGELTAFQRAFLAADAKTKAAYELVAELDLSDLSDAEEEEIAAVETVIWGLKNLLYEIGKGDGSKLRLQMMRIAGKPLSSSTIADIRGEMNAEVFRAAGNSWFTKFSQEIANRAAGTATPTQSVPSPTNTDSGDENRQANGGWYRMTEDFTIRYRPTGHGDSFVRSWLDLSASRYGSQDFAKRLVAQLGSRSESPGMCMKCHTLDTQADGNLMVNWQGARPDNLAKSFTKFSHVSHFALLNDQGCYRCHQLNLEASYEEAYEGFDPAKYVSNFQSIQKSTCVECHSNDRVGTDCQSCHRYHVGAFTSMGAQIENLETQLVPTEEPEESKEETGNSEEAPASDESSSSDSEDAEETSAVSAETAPETDDEVSGEEEESEAAIEMEEADTYTGTEE